MARSWDSRKDTEAVARGTDEPNVKALSDAIKQSGQWTVRDVVAELGGTGRDATHRLAEQMLAARGLEITSKNVSNQMRSINRWVAGETGRAAEVRKPNKEMQTILNRIGRNAAMARDGFTVAMSGDIGVAGYRRSNRNAMVHMQGAAAAAWLENPDYGTMGQFYEGNAIAGYGADLQVSII